MGKIFDKLRSEGVPEIAGLHSHKVNRTKSTRLRGVGSVDGRSWPLIAPRLLEEWWGAVAMATRVNLDAMIPRADFALLASESSVQQITDFRIEYLGGSSPILKQLRKPDFQRETNHWSPEQIVTFVASFLESDSNRLHEANPLISNHLHAPCTRLSYGETS